MQLTYALTTNPDPMQTGRANSTMTVIASAARAGMTTLTEIQISIPLGTGTTSLATTTTTIAAAGPDGWTLSGNASQGTFIFTPPVDGDNGLSGGLVFQFSNITVNDSTGTAQVTVMENGSTANIAYLPVSKFPPDFHVSALIANPPEVAAGGTVDLSWSGSEGYNYAITPEDLLSVPIDPSMNSGQVTTKPLTENTIFTLSVSNGDNQSSFVTQQVAGVTVEPPTLTDFRMNGATSLSQLDLGEVVTLSWTTSNATQVVILVDGSPVAFYDADDPAPTLAIALPGSYRAMAFFGEISGGIHSPMSESVEVSLAPPTATLSVTPDLVYADYSAVSLTWTTQNATTVLLQTGAQGNQFEVALSATDYAVWPQSTTQYKITAIYDPEEARRDVALALQMPPQTSQAVATTADKVETSTTCTLTMAPSPLMAFTNTFYPGSDSGSHSLPNPGGVAVSYIRGFNCTFEEDKKHNLLNWTLSVTPSLSEDGTSVSVGHTMKLEDDSDNTINSSATLDTVTFCLPPDFQGAFLENIVAVASQNYFTFPGTGYDYVPSGISKFAFFSEVENDGMVRSFYIYVSPANTVSPDEETDTTSVNIDFNGACGGEKDYYYSLSFAPMAPLTVPSGRGFDVKEVSQGTTMVNFAQPVLSAYAVLSYWQDDGDGDEHTVQQLYSQTVTATPSGTGVTLNWGSSYWADGKHDPWNASRKVMVIALFDNHSLTTGPN